MKDIIRRGSPAGTVIGMGKLEPDTQNPAAHEFRLTPSISGSERMGPREKLFKKMVPDDS